MMMSRNRLLLAAVAVAALVGMGVLFGDLWPAPDDAMNRENPLPNSPANRDAAERLFAEHCAKCHGDDGRGDGPEAMMYSVKPADFTHAERMNSIPDGELFYVLSEGRVPMPPFKNQLSETQRWQLIHFVREFARKK
jgi:mono/diheme cytochrome c family protein